MLDRKAGGIRTSKFSTMSVSCFHVRLKSAARISLKWFLTKLCRSASVGLELTLKVCIVRDIDTTMSYACARPLAK